MCTARYSHSFTLRVGKGPDNYAYSAPVTAKFQNQFQAQRNYLLPATAELLPPSLLSFARTAYASSRINIVVTITATSIMTNTQAPV